ncbi:MULTISPECIES: 2,3-bisphosphoglycerate-independent phosphoglycerate mutase [Kosmotoga]|uniref:Probable 2,3-bisphosphoglycerate-independent phosphoglycerate mutase n=1 Tax=Kosmotoga olearia (strain ATCC BAA-1733 / DSM 21960 / TBF 19.5.1) TaxID=521045 RepID=C5CEN6_KOSOT|nr:MULTISPECIES: 2,3-bisphosphoglycerate-independent phosphoglycerate mutase [Kosmotoga]ACR80216.1 phosphonopyruvate decarboxylase-related protein [Kosmotoga olearia TBF 19.5.1]MDI3523500.1 2,3-bisphosphoglycerate-independent phosphoglycerate mutase [Kosmotoga sp.]MDK2952958.1 2,3-bisphosphoglycerate-independent phosphoglycerate mutase [Kosmotoga sp.]OAA20156.1 phosphoglycerate mutase [Kosmotoga sp. DU53]
MDRQEFISKLVTRNDTKIVLLVMDGVGDLPVNGRTPLQAARTPNLDALAKKSELGQAVPVIPGVTPGSGPGHLGLFGYDPIKYQIGRGILEALGSDVEVGEKDLVARANFATIDGDTVVDRRAGRPATEESAKVVEKLAEEIKKIEDIEISLYPGKEHRFVVKFTGEGLDERICDADPQKTGLPIVWAEALVPEAEKTARVVNEFLRRVKEILKDEEKMNFALLRGFSKYPQIPNFEEVYKLRAAAIATYPMYRGLAKLVGMNVVATGTTIKDEVETLKEIWNDYDFFFFHVKKTDSYGEDGNFESKVHVIEEVDDLLPEILALNPDVLVVTGDHSTPVPMKAHSWHPVPFMVYSGYVRAGASEKFDEFECARGVIGTIYAVDEIPLMLAHAMRLEKYGA